MNDSVLSCYGLSKSFHDGDRQLDILQGIDFELPPSKTVGILGASGSGKTTLLHLLAGLDDPTSGKIFWEGQEIQTLSEQKKCYLRNAHFGFIYQFHHLLPEFSALENVAMPLLIAKESLSEANFRSAKILEAVGLKERMHHKPSELSGGERQRVAIARAIVTQPKCVLADEPTGNLDQETAHDMLDLILDLHREYNVSFVIVTHSLSLAKKLDCAYSLKLGKLQKENL